MKEMSKIKIDRVTVSLLSTNFSNCIIQSNFLFSKEMIEITKI